MRFRLIELAFLVLSFLPSVVLLWPAPALAPWVERASNGHWRLASAEGSIWNGNGMILAQSANSTSWHIAQNIRWQVRWSELWRGRLGVDAIFEQGSSLIAVTLDGLSIERLDATLPAPMLLVLLPGALSRYGWGGSMHLSSNTFRCSWRRYACVGEIGLQWNGAEVAEIPGNQLGDYRFRLVGESRVFRIDLATLRGRLLINGSGEISAGGLRFKGEATATGSNPATLNAMLSTLGRRTSIPGRYLIDYHEVTTGQ
ncbi:MAG: type II secretion system protein N [Sterolibacterium sp.]